MIKLLILSLLLVPSLARAGESPCENFLICGTYLAAEPTKPGYVQEVIFSDAGEGLVKYERVKSNGTERRSSASYFKFSADGTFIVTDADLVKPYGLGICINRVCTMSLAPVEAPLGLLVQKMTFRFSETQLISEKLLSYDSGETKTVSGTLIRK
ncbi:MAG: hypothetical protein EOP11_00195 [Proteobacteria bacterium]|nr:MAG: hypothetical protein EOP11_00195 [Pseudomonadota bacterium]